MRSSIRACSVLSEQHPRLFGSLRTASALVRFSSNLRLLADMLTSAME
jgi:hypothetical protein